MPAEARIAFARLNERSPRNAGPIIIISTWTYAGNGKFSHSPTLIEVA